jgi:zinc protease
MRRFAGRLGPALALGFIFAGILALPARSELFAADGFTLANGLQVVVIENHRSPVVAQMLFYRAGGADAPAGKSGIAHFLEHLMFKGTPSVPDGDFSRRISRLGGTDNAYTTEDYTAYHQTIARQHLATIMEMEADRMTHLILRDNEVLSERDVIIEERRQRVDDDPSGRLAEMMQAALFLNHPYRLPVLGWEHEMHGLNREDALAFYRRWYAPNNAILVIAGDTTLAEVKALAERDFGPIPARSLPPRERLREPPSYAARRVILRDPAVRQAAWQRIYLAPTERDKPAGQSAALDVLGEIMAGGPTSRLYRHLVIEQALAVDVDASYSGQALDYGQFSISAAPQLGADTDELENAIDQEIATLLAKGVAGQELADAKARLAADAIKARDSLRGPAQIVGSGLVTGSTLAEVQSWPERIAAVSADDVLQAALAVLKTKQNSVTGILLPEHRDGAAGAEAPLPHRQLPAGAIQ